MLTLKSLARTRGHLALAATLAAGLALASGPDQSRAQEMTQSAALPPSFGGFAPPAGWLPPPLDPTGVELETRKIAPGVYALLSNQPPVDNSGFVVGARGVLVIDAHINGEMARQIQTAVRRVTDKPILYLVNTNAHGDHSFGNHAFPAETAVIAHRKTAEAMTNFEEEKANLLPAVGGKREIFGDVELRLPDVTFEKTLRLDLGGRVVELHHFGHGNTPGDTVVYVPEDQVAWTGNLVLGEASIPWAIEGNVQAYLETLAAMTARLDIETIIPGHVLTTSGATLSTYLHYLGGLIEDVQDARRAGLGLEETLAALPLDERYLPPADSPLAAARPVLQGFHLWNVKKTYQEMGAQ